MVFCIPFAAVSFPVCPANADMLSASCLVHFRASTRSRIGRRGCTGSICQSIVTSCFDWSSPRNKRVTDGLNFPSNDYIYHGLTRQGAEIVSVASVDGMTVPLERILEAIDERTKLVSISRFAFRSSSLQDLAAIAHDFATGGCVKWLLGGPGAGCLYVRADLDPKLRPTAVGWAAHASRFEFVGGPIEYAPDIRRFLNGTPNVPTMYSARSSYEIVNEIGTTAIRAKSKRQIIGLADEAGFTIRSPRDLRVVHTTGSTGRHSNP